MSRVALRFPILYVLEDQELLEAFTLEAFELSAAANLPARLLAGNLQKAPLFPLEGGVNAAWVMLPLRRPRYKRCSRTFNVGHPACTWLKLSRASRTRRFPRTWRISSWLRRR